MTEVVSKTQLMSGKYVSASALSPAARRKALRRLRAYRAGREDMGINIFRQKGIRQSEGHRFPQRGPMPESKVQLDDPFKRDAFADVTSYGRFGGTRRFVQQNRDWLRARRQMDKMLDDVPGGRESLAAARKRGDKTLVLDAKMPRTVGGVAWRFGGRRDVGVFFRQADKDAVATAERAKRTAVHEAGPKGHLSAKNLTRPGKFRGKTGYGTTPAMMREEARADAQFATRSGNLSHGLKGDDGYPRYVTSGTAGSLGKTYASHLLRLSRKQAGSRYSSANDPVRDRLRRYTKAPGPSIS